MGKSNCGYALHRLGAGYLVSPRKSTEYPVVGLDNREYFSGYSGLYLSPNDSNFHSVPSHKIGVKLLLINSVLLIMDQLSHSRREWLPAYDITLQVITTLLIGIRLLSRFHHTGGILGIDDLFISIAWAITTAGNALILLCMLNICFLLRFVAKRMLILNLVDYKYGLDRHMWDVPVALWQYGTFVRLHIHVL